MTVISTIAGANAHHAPSVSASLRMASFNTLAERDRVVGAEAEHAERRLGEDARSRSAG